MVLLTQYFDTLHALGADARSKVVFLPSNPGAVGELMNQIRMALASGLESEFGVTTDTVFYGVPPKPVRNPGNIFH